MWSIILGISTRVSEEIIFLSPRKKAIENDMAHVYSLFYSRY
jgi:hypothetical protein